MAEPVWEMYRVGIKPPRTRAQFFEWAGPATSLDGALAWALADLAVAWQALAVGRGSPDLPLPEAVATAAPKLISHVPQPQDWMLRYLPMWTVGSAMHKALGPHGTRPAPYRNSDAGRAVMALTRHVAAARGLWGSRGLLTMRVEINDMETSPSRDVIGFNDVVFDDPKTTPGHPYLPTDARVSRAAMAIAAVDLGRATGKFKGKRGREQAIASSSTLRVAAMASDRISRQDDVLSWFAAIGLPEVATQLKEL